MRICEVSRKYNSGGYTLIEAIIAIGMASFVVTAVTVIMSFALRSYHNESANVSMQYEVQTTINQVMDSVMQSNGMVIKQNGAYTESAVFGTFEEKKDTVTNKISISYKGDVYYAEETSGDITVYMNRIVTPIVIVKTIGDADANDLVEAVAQEALATITGASDKKIFLLSEHAKVFHIEAVNNCLFEDTDGVKKYNNPITVRATVEFKVKAYRDIERKVTDETTMRNKALCDIYVDGVKYIRKKPKDTDI